ncbi:MAG TPA: 4Fe-4S double cluster binding domain-containing protein [Methanocella sp.]
MSLDGRLRQIASNEGADFYGVADLVLAKDEVVRQGGPELAAYPRAISIGIRLFDEIVDRLPDRDHIDVAVSYRHHCYDVVNDRLDDLASRIAGELQREGYKAYPLPSSKRVDSERICALFSHTLAAHLAGLGWIGKSCLLVTPEHGPRVRFVSVLTDAPLEAGVPIEVACGDCTECVDACPMSAFTGRAFREDEPREARYDARKCEKYFGEMEKQGRPAVCGLCLYACPYGKK